MRNKISKTWGILEKFLVFEIFCKIMFEKKNLMKRSSEKFMCFLPSKFWFFFLLDLNSYFAFRTTEWTLLIFIQIGWSLKAKRQRLTETKFKKISDSVCWDQNLFVKTPSEALQNVRPTLMYIPCEDYTGALKYKIKK
jgi:hypothetical protein